MTCTSYGINVICNIDYVKQPHLTGIDFVTGVYSNQEKGVSVNGKKTIHNHPVLNRRNSVLFGYGSFSTCLSEISLLNLLVLAYCRAYCLRPFSYPYVDYAAYGI